MSSILQSPKCWPELTDISFFMLKPETYLLGKQAAVLKLVEKAGFEIITAYRIKLSFKDLMRMYQSTKARVTMSLRLPHLMPLDLYIVKKDNAISTLNQLKYRIRAELLGWNIGGFLHAPDSITEFVAHMHIFAQVELTQGHKQQGRPKAANQSKQLIKLD